MIFLAVKVVSTAALVAPLCACMGLHMQPHTLRLLARSAPVTMQSDRPRPPCCVLTRHPPFTLSNDCIAPTLQDEAALQQQHVVHASAMAALLQGLPPGGLAATGGAAAGAAAGAGTGDSLSLSLSLRVRRGHEMEDALRQIRLCGAQVGGWSCGRRPPACSWLTTAGLL